MRELNYELPKWTQIPAREVRVKDPEKPIYTPDDLKFLKEAGISPE